MGLAFIPFYVATLGIEAWGLVGFMVMLQAWFLLLDMGLTPALSREMARFLGGEHNAQSLRDLLRSLEIVYGGIAVTIILAVSLCAEWVAKNWLNASQLPSSAVSHALAVMGLVIAARMIEQIYRGAIQGLQRQVWLNGALAFLATLRWAGVIPVLLWVEGSVRMFFLWQGLISILSIAVLARYTYRNLPLAGKSGRFVLQTLNNIKGFAGGMAATTLLALMLTQIDKLMLSKLVSLDEFGYYTLASSVAAALGFLVAPVATAVLPRMTESLARSDYHAVILTYHSSSQWLSVVLIPASLVMAAFSEPLIFAWTGDRDLAERTAPLLSVLALGTMCNGFMHIPYMAQLAHGWTGLAVRINIVAVCIIVPVLLWSVPKFGVMGAAWAWLLLNAGYVLIGIHFMHSRIMLDEKWKWYRYTVFLPLAMASFIVVLIFNMLNLPNNRLGMVFILLLTGIFTVGCVVAIMPSSRNYFIKKMGRSQEGLSGKFK
jgi:O-antigen/teichoic acid export membrane protein